MSFSFFLHRQPPILLSPVNNISPSRSAFKSSFSAPVEAKVTAIISLTFLTREGEAFSFGRFVAPEAKA